MASVTFGTLRLNLAADPSQSLALSLHSIDHTQTPNVTNTVYAGGNIRSSRTPGSPRQSKVVLNFVADDDLTTLQAWQGETVCLRDPKGAKFYGNYVDLDWAPRPGPVGTPTSFTFNEVTFSEAV
jgi:hypothetical protein